MKINLSDKSKTVINWAIMIGGAIVSAIASERLSEKETRDRVDDHFRHFREMNGRH